MSVSFLLEDEIDIGRGDMIVSAANLPSVGKEAEAMLCWMHHVPLQLGRRYTIKHTTNSTKGILTDVNYRVNIDNLEEEKASTLGLNEIGRVSLRTAAPLIYDDYYRNRRLGGFIVIDETTHATVGAGMLLDPTRVPPLPEYTDYAI
jgi:bifunctional enzyme CysN/CysC